MYFKKNEQYRLFRFIVKRLSDADRKLLSEKHPDTLKSGFNITCSTYIKKIKKIIDILEPDQEIY